MIPLRLSWKRASLGTVLGGIQMRGARGSPDPDYEALSIYALPWAVEVLYAGPANEMKLLPPYESAEVRY